MLRSALSPSQIRECASAAFPESWRGILPFYPRDECGHEPFRHSQRDARQGRGKRKTQLEQGGARFKSCRASFRPS